MYLHVCLSQTRPVLVYRLVTCGTVEEKIVRKQIFKRGLNKMVLQQVGVDQICLCICLFICLYTCTFLCIHVRVYACMHACILARFRGGLNRMVLQLFGVE